MGIFGLQYAGRCRNRGGICPTGQKSTGKLYGKTITEALLADPYQRTKRVYDFTFVWKTDGVEVTFWVNGLWYQEKELTAFLVR